MSIRAGFYSYLSAQASVTALVGTRIYPDKAPDTPETLPRIVYSRISTARPHNLKTSDGLPTTRIQVECHGATAIEADNVAAAVRPLFDGFRGTMGSVTVQACFVEDESDEYDKPEHADDRAIHRTHFDVLITHVETFTEF